MANSTLAEMTDINTITGAELIYVDNGSADRKATINEVLAYFKTVFTDNLEFVCDGGGSALTAKYYGYIEVPYACTIKQVTTLGDVSGSVVVDLYRCTYSAFAPGTHPVSGDKLTASAPPTISSAFKAQDATLTGWTTSLAAGDILAFVVTGTPTTITRATVSIKIQMT
jgi:hypothetical protein